jgi:hypothetical protein
VVPQGLLLQARPLQAPSGPGRVVRGERRPKRALTPFVPGGLRGQSAKWLAGLQRQGARCCSGLGRLVQRGLSRRGAIWLARRKEKNDQVLVRGTFWFCHTKRKINLRRNPPQLLGNCQRLGRPTRRAEKPSATSWQPTEAVMREKHAYSGWAVLFGGHPRWAITVPYLKRRLLRGPLYSPETGSPVDSGHGGFIAIVLRRGGACVLRRCSTDMPRGGAGFPLPPTDGLCGRMATRQRSYEQQGVPPRRSTP